MYKNKINVKGTVYRPAPSPFWPIMIRNDELICKYWQWCCDNIDVSDWKYYDHTTPNPYEFRFKNPDDLLMFKLVFGL